MHEYTRDKIFCDYNYFFLSKAFSDNTLMLHAGEKSQFGGFFTTAATSYLCKLLSQQTATVKMT